MSKKITGDDGKTYVQKKPFYKRVWFWILAIIVIAVIGGAMGGSNEGDTAKKVDSSSDAAKKVSNSGSKTESSAKQTTFKVGETAEYKGVQFKVNKVDYTNGDGDIDSPDSGKQYVVVNITITNNSDDKIDYNPFDYKLDDNGNQTDFDSTVSTVDSELNSGTLAKGASVTGNLVGEATTSDKLKLIYQGNMFSEAEHVVFELN
ncbi:DUF4352 domain-containing protein [Leuconostoc pseudomesenteroides]|nr:DUF4352 domain-containing protein [Leuconostoc pseudomesenteroides]